ncbi:Zinc finger CCHC-type [Trinorchestia longiramus]|nr:Zinc finger CCHC-type [Trinorchestia longiramus]
MEEEERVIILLSSLPDWFSTLVTALEANEKIPSWEVVTERLLNEERRQRGGPRTSDSSEKLIVSFKRNKTLIKCFECGKEGPIKKQCRVYEARLRKENRMFQANRAVDTRSSSKGETTLFTIAFPIGNVDCDSWIVDSGATQHMCNKKSQFSSYSDLSSPVRVEIDGRVLKGVGVGDLLLKVTLPNLQKDKITSFDAFKPERNLQKQYKNLIISRSKERLVCLFMTDYFTHTSAYVDTEKEKKLVFLTRQLELLSQKQFSMNDYCFALQSYTKGYYEQLRDFLVLPCKRKLQYITSSIDKNQVLRETFDKVQTLEQKNVFLLVDEVQIRRTVLFSVLETVRPVLSDSKSPKTFWAEAVSTAVYVKNRNKNLTPYQTLNEHKPNVQHFRTFGCMACCFFGVASVTFPPRLCFGGGNNNLSESKVKGVVWCTSSWGIQ